jgi:deoxyribose-phosphate aldolase
MPDYRYEDLARMLDTSVLVPHATWADMEAGCRVALAYETASVCCMPYFIGRCAEMLAGSDVVPCCVIGFPHGTHLTAAKVAEAQAATAAGARELDMVCNISAVKSGRFDLVRDDIAAVLDAARTGGAKLKVIFECCYLSDEEKIRLCKICGELGVDWVKTSTGFGNPTDGRPAGATDEDLILMRKHSPDRVQVKASGGIRDFDRLVRVRELGCTRAGATATKKILDEARRQLGLEPIEVDGGESGASTY